MASMVANISMKMVEVSHKDIGLVIELPSNNDISCLSLSFKLAYVGAIVMFPNTLLKMGCKYRIPECNLFLV